MKVFKELASIRPIFAGILISATLASCSSSPKKNPPPPPPSFDMVMSEAESKVGTAGPDAAIASFEEAAKTDPTRKEPWVRIAQLQFDRGDYARAIVAAEEVLQRDPDDLIADGVLTVSGFRVADQSLQRLHERGALASDTARKEAETLATTLRTTMGDAILAPPERPKPKRRVRRPASTNNAGETAPSTPAKAPAAPASPSRGSGSADPFKSIGGN